MLHRTLRNGFVCRERLFRIRPGIWFDNRPGGNSMPFLPLRLFEHGHGSIRFRLRIQVPALFTESSTKLTLQ